MDVNKVASCTDSNKMKDTKIISTVSVEDCMFSGWDDMLNLCTNGHD
jgi:hypothetical protein